MQQMEGCGKRFCTEPLTPLLRCNPLHCRQRNSLLLPLLLSLAERSSGFGSAILHGREGTSTYQRVYDLTPSQSQLYAIGSPASDDPATKKSKKSGTKKTVPATSMEKGQTKGKRTMGKRQKKSDEPIHWVLESDDIVLQWPLFNEEDETTNFPNTVSTANTTITASYSSYRKRDDNERCPSLVQFTVRGNPLPLRRHRTSRGFVYNPSAAAQKSFREAVEQILANRIDYGSAPGNTPIWKSEHTLTVAIVFRMKRPKLHFIAGKPGPGRLRNTAPKQSCSNMRTDVDNLAKFVLDSLNGVMYEDDRQIASLHVTKLYDNDTDELCRGSTSVCLRVLHDKDLPQLLANSFDLY